METFVMCVLLSWQESAPTCWKVVTTTQCAQEMHAQWEKSYAWISRSKQRNKLTFFITCAPYGQFNRWERFTLPNESHESNHD